jgi:hypothetical protein
VFLPFRSSGFSPLEVVGHSDDLVPPLASLPPSFDGSFLLAPSVLFGICLIGTSIGAYLLLRRMDSPALLSLSGFVSLSLGAVGLAAANVLLLGLSFPLPSRYGLSCLAFLSLSFAARLVTKARLILAATLASLSVIALGVGLLGIE